MILRIHRISPGHWCLVWKGKALVHGDGLPFWQVLRFGYVEIKFYERKMRGKSGFSGWDCWWMDLKRWLKFRVPMGTINWNEPILWEEDDD